MFRDFATLRLRIDAIYCGCEVELSVDTGRSPLMSVMILSPAHGEHKTQYEHKSGNKIANTPDRREQRRFIKPFSRPVKGGQDDHGTPTL